MKEASTISRSQAAPIKLIFKSHLDWCMQIKFPGKYLNCLHSRIRLCQFRGIGAWRRYKTQINVIFINISIITLFAPTRQTPCLQAYRDMQIGFSNTLNFAKAMHAPAQHVRAALFKRLGGNGIIRTFSANAHQISMNARRFIFEDYLQQNLL